MKPPAGASGRGQIKKKKLKASLVDAAQDQALTPKKRNSRDINRLNDSIDNGATSSKKSRPGSSYSSKDKRNSKGFNEFRSVSMTEERKSTIKSRPYSSGGFNQEKNNRNPLANQSNDDHLQDSDSDDSAEESDRTFSLENAEEEQEEEGGNLFDDDDQDEKEDIELRVYDARYKIPTQASSAMMKGEKGKKVNWYYKQRIICLEIFKKWQSLTLVTMMAFAMLFTMGIYIWQTYAIWS